MAFTWATRGKWSYAADQHEVWFHKEGAADNQFGFLLFQDGPIAEHGVNGTTNEEVIATLIERLQSLNQPPYSCKENACAITHLEEALHWLEARTRNRQKRKVEGTPTP